ncbi:Uncharacterised protein [Vibrio cholerae]|nr:Uncharacterised protein [Vibrio cholerae]
MLVATSAPFRFESIEWNREASPLLAQVTWHAPSLRD